MNYMDLIRARRRSGKIPSLRPIEWDASELKRIQQGLCVRCGQLPQQMNSFLCADCESTGKVEDVRKEIVAARKPANDDK